MKDKAMEVPAIREIIEKMEAEMAGNGRILVRPSGTEPLLRVMAEAPTHEEVDYYCRYHCCSCSSRNRTLTL